MCVCLNACGVKIVKEAKTAVSQTLEQTQSCVNKHAGPFHNTFPRVMRWKKLLKCSSPGGSHIQTCCSAAHPHYKDKQPFDHASDLLFSRLNVLLYFAADCVWCKIRRPHKVGRMTKMWGILYHKYSVSVYFVYFCFDNENSSKESWAQLPVAYLWETHSSAVPEQISVLEQIGWVNASITR